MVILNVDIVNREHCEIDKPSVLLTDFMEEAIMIDNGKVKDNHQQGIERVKQRKGDMEVGQGGKMSQKPREGANWKRPDNAVTPRKA